MSEHTPEPALRIHVRKPAWNPNYKGPYEGEFYAAEDFAVVTAQRDELLAALKIVTTGTVQTLMKHNKEWKALVAKCEANP